jgi:tRNA pseudouridine38-40 synthase
MYNNYVLFVIYDGYNYKGFQIQQDFDTIQKRIYDALNDTFNYFKLNLKIVSMSYTGRTDAKVSAIKQVFNFKTDNPIKINSELFLDVFNSFLPNDIKAYKFSPVKTNFNSRYEAIYKIYIYKAISFNISINKKYNILNILENEEYFKNERDYIKDKYGFFNFIFLPDFNNQKKQKIIDALSYFNTEANFQSFYKPDKVNKNTILKLESFVDFYSFDNIEIINLEFKSKYFLRNMIRKIVGTILAYVYDEITIEYIKDMFDNPDPSKGKYIASPCGLILFNSIYNEDLYLI